MQRHASSGAPRSPICLGFIQVALLPWVRRNWLGWVAYIHARLLISLKLQVLEKLVFVRVIKRSRLKGWHRFYFELDIQTVAFQCGPQRLLLPSLTIVREGRLRVFGERRCGSQGVNIRALNHARSEPMGCY